jgi:hypothetical protein
MINSHFMGETASLLDVISVLMSLIGTVGVVVYGPKVDDIDGQFDKYTGLLHFWQEDGLQVLIPLMMTIFMICVAAYRVIQGPARNVVLPVIGGIFGCMSEVSTKLIGLWGSQGVENIMQSIPEFFASVVLVVFFAITSVSITTLGSERLSQRYFGPQYVSMSSTWMQVLGCWGFGEWAYMPQYNRFYFVVYGTLCVAAVVLSSFNVVTDAVKSKNNPREVKASGTTEFCNFGADIETTITSEANTDVPSDQGSLLGRSISSDSVISYESFV